LRENNRVLEEKVTDYYNAIASKEFENIELREKIEGLEKEDPIVLVRGIIYIFSLFACKLMASYIYRDKGNT
jgi:hypothetical protein